MVVFNIITLLCGFALLVYSAYGYIVIEKTIKEDNDLKEDDMNVNSEDGE